MYIMIQKDDLCIRLFVTSSEVRRMCWIISQAAYGHIETLNTSWMIVNFEGIMYKNWTSLPSPLGFFCYRACFLSFILGYLFSTHHVQLWVTFSYHRILLYPVVDWCVRRSITDAVVHVTTWHNTWASIPAQFPRLIKDAQPDVITKISQCRVSKDLCE